MKINPFSLYRMLDRRRHQLGALDPNISGDALPWTSVGSQVGIHSAAFSRLRLGNTLSAESTEKLLAWLGTPAAQFELLSLIGDASLPLAGTDVEWDAAGAADRVFELFTDEDGVVDEAGVSAAFLWRDDDADPAIPAAYFLGIADVVDDALTIIPQGVAAAASAVEGLELEEEDQTALQNTICGLYDSIQEADDQFPDCPFAEPEPETDPADAENSVINPTDNSAVAAILQQLSAALGVQAPSHVTLNTTEPPCTTCGDGHDHAMDDEPPDNDETDTRTAAIFGIGLLSVSEDPETQAAVTRVRELLTEGAVGVSIRHDMNPEDLPAPELIAQLEAEERWQELEDLFKDVRARPRHLAIVDTAAFSDSRLVLNDDGTVSGNVAFEGLWTGDVRRLPYGVLVWDEDLLPIPIIWDRSEGDHTGTVVGSITSLERIDGVTSSMRYPDISEDQIQAVTAAAGFSGSLFPSEYFAQFRATELMPVHIGEPDTNGLRRIWGHAAPYGVCHRSDMGACFQYPKDVDKDHRGFHTGAAVTLSDGKKIRVGALTAGGMHLDLRKLARQGVSLKELNRHREDISKVLGMVRCWEDQFGLAFSGVVPPDVTRSDLIRAMAGAPSVELWPSGRGRTLSGIHIVPRPAWPVTASMGEALEMTSTQEIVVDDVDSAPDDVDLESSEPVATSTVLESLARIESALALLTQDLMLRDIPIPEVTENGEPPTD